MYFIAHNIILGLLPTRNSHSRFKNLSSISLNNLLIKIDANIRLVLPPDLCIYLLIMSGGNGVRLRIHFPASSLCTPSRALSIILLWIHCHHSSPLRRVFSVQWVSSWYIIVFWLQEMPSDVYLQPQENIDIFNKFRKLRHYLLENLFAVLKAHQHEFVEKKSACVFLRSFNNSKQMFSWSSQLLLFSSSKRRRKSSILQFREVVFNMPHAPNIFFHSPRMLEMRENYFWRWIAANVNSQPFVSPNKPEED